MRLHNMLTSAALVTLMMAAISTHSAAGDLLSGVSSTLGGTLGGTSAGTGGGSLASVHADANLGGVSAKADAKLGTSSGKLLDAGVNAKLGHAPKSLNAKAKAEVSRKITARASVLSGKRLLALCVNVGASGCGHAPRTKQLALIKARLNSLSGQRLVDACVSIGGGCGGSLASGGNGSGGGGNGGGGHGGSKGTMLASAGSGKDRDVQITCRSVLSNPVRYEMGMVKLCRKLTQ